MGRIPIWSPSSSHPQQAIRHVFPQPGRCSFQGACGSRSVVFMAFLSALILSLATAVTSAVWPLDPTPEVVARFDPPAQEWGAGHRGVDLGGHPGQSVRSAAAGTVTYAARLAGRGVVTVDHGGVRTTYEPVDASVRRGDAVDRGEVIGTLQVFGSHCFPRACLHWGALRGDVYLDPLTLVGAGPVRLLPLDGTR